MKDTYYITIHGWMIQRLKLSGNKLIVYAVIYDFSQDGKYTASAGWLAECTGISRQAVLEILKTLTKDGLLVKETRTENGVKLCVYSAVKPGQETLPRSK
jgi:DNA-binding MarR family transcriptional regulator